MIRRVLRPTPLRLAAGVLTASTVAGHIGYPLVLRALTGARRVVTRHRLDRRPAPYQGPITVLVPCYLECGVIVDKIRNVHEVGYGGPMRVLVVADGDAETAEAARGTGSEVLLLPERRGKSQALNAALEIAQDEVVVFTDANSVLRPGSLDALVAPFSDPKVGAVAGEKDEGDGGERSYWRFASSLKRMESELGTTLGLDGGLAAIRRSAWRPIPKDVSNDDYWIALDLMERGFSVKYAPDATMREDTIGALPLKWERRTRVLGGSLFIAWRKRHLLWPTAGLVSLELWGHKVWRSTIGPISHVALLGVALATARRSWIARLFLAGHLWAGATIAKPTLPLGKSGQVLFLQAVALGGMIRIARGDRMLAWKKPAR